MTPDSELLGRYAKTNSEDAFAEIVRRHVNLVYSAALRQVNGDEHLAKDVAQTVFTDLARKAYSLSRRKSLSGWLYTSAHFAAAKIVRGENRRRDREEKFMREPINENSAGVPTANAIETDWEKIRPALDDAMHELKESDRDAILLRYFENRQFAEVGAKLGLNENAARMRVERALEKLRKIFLRRGVAATSALVSIISANAVQIAPANLAVTLTTTSITSAGTGTFTFLKIMTATQIKLGVSAIAVAGVATALVVQHQTQDRLRGKNESLQQQLVQLQADNVTLSNRIVSIDRANSLTDSQMNELLKLRAEVGLLRKKTNEISKLREESQQSITASEFQPIKHSSTLSQTDFSKESWEFAGYATPPAAMETWVWALNKGDKKMILASLTPGHQAQWQKILDGVSDAELTKGSPFTAFHIVSTKTISDDTVNLTIVSDYPDGSKTGEQNYALQKVGADWKMAGQALQ